MTLYSSVRSGLVLVCAAAAAALAGCESVPFMPTADRISGLITPYKVEIVQGNVVTQEQVDRIRTGMSRPQVRDILGSPLLADVFHADRWDYVFTIRRQGTEPQQRNVVALFDGERLKSLDTGGELPTELAFVASIDATKPDIKIPPLTMSEDRLKSLKKPATAAAEPTAAAAAAAPAAPRVYPPLEPL